MPPSASEQTVITLFADVHYCLSPPNHRPRQSRFEKSSYVYLYTTPSLSARIEIANNPGTPHQDAFTGSLTHISIKHSKRQPHLVTFEVMRRVDGDSMWQLRSPDNSGRLDLLHALDVYFFTGPDALKFVDACGRLNIGEILVDGQKRGAARASPDQRDTVSPVVQKLEQAAISQPQPTHPSQRSDSVSTIASNVHPAPSFPPPPPGGPQAQAGQQQQPLAYNPAAPPAPEPIAHREKTPPPPDNQGTGLKNTEYHEQSPGNGYTFNAQQGSRQGSVGSGYTGQQQSYHPQNTTPSFSPPPSSVGHSGSFPPPPPQTHHTPPNHTSAYPTPPSSSQQHQQHHPSFSQQPTSPGYPPPPSTQQQRTNSLPFQQYASPPTSPGHPPAQSSVPAAYQPSLGSPAPNSGNPTHPSNPAATSYIGHQSPSPYHNSSPYQPQHPPQQPQQALYSTGSAPQSPGFPPQSPGYTPGTPGYAPGTPGYPPGTPGHPPSAQGYSQGQSYSQGASQPHSQSFSQGPSPGQGQRSGSLPSAQSIHQSVYMPSESERPSPKLTSGREQVQGKLGDRADRVEKGVNRFLKRLDKHW
ncbi:MAG: hypothetical protein Q9162_000190 [Coniocarpon cinnabarinum]